MRAVHVMGVISVVVLSATLASAEMTSGPQVGEPVGAFLVTKVTGNPDDGVADGKTLCYRCRMGKKPVVMVFSRSADEKFAKFLKKLEAELEEHADQQLTAFVNMIGTDTESLKKEAADFAAKNGITRIAFVVPEEAENGPEDFNIAPDAEITVVCYKGGTVKANHAVAKGGLNDDAIDAMVEASCNLVE